MIIDVNAYLGHFALLPVAARHGRIVPGGDGRQADRPACRRTMVSAYAAIPPNLSPKCQLALLGSKTHPDFKKRHHLWAKDLLWSRVEKLIADARQECAGSVRAEAVEKELG